MVHYVDTSALVKLVVAEPGSTELWEWWQKLETAPVTGDLARTELMRAVRRVQPTAAPRARSVLDLLVIVQFGTDLFEAAGRLGPPELRTLDALHLACALALGDELSGMVTYDSRLAEAASAFGVPVVAPGASATGRPDDDG